MHAYDLQLAAAPVLGHYKFSLFIYESDTVNKGTPPVALKQTPRDWEVYLNMTDYNLWATYIFILKLSSTVTVRSIKQALVNIIAMT